MSEVPIKEFRLDLSDVTLAYIPLSGCRFAATPLEIAVFSWLCWLVWEVVRASQHVGYKGIFTSHPSIARLMFHQISGYWEIVIDNSNYAYP